MPINHLSTNHYSFLVEIRSLISLYWIRCCGSYKSSAPADILRIIQHLQTCSKLSSICRHSQNYPAPADMLRIIQHLQTCSKLSSTWDMPKSMNFELLEQPWYEQTFPPKSTNFDLLELPWYNPTFLVQSHYNPILIFIILFSSFNKNIAILHLPTGLLLLCTCRLV